MSPRSRNIGSRPTELAVTLAAAAAPWDGSNGWLTADEIRQRLTWFGHHCSPQWLSATLKRMCEADAPWLERQRGRWGGDWWEYRVTRWGANDIDNTLKNLRARLPWLEVARV
jgi:hypothetical protein